MNVLATGLSGLVGSGVAGLLAPYYSFQLMDRSHGVNLLDTDTVEKIFSVSDAAWVFHLAAYTHVDNAEKDRINGENGESWKLNVSVTEHLARLCKQYRKKLFYISTDFVFDGQKDVYTEEDIPNPVSWYGYTKYMGEQSLREWLPDNHVIARISYPYRKPPLPRPDFVQVIKSKLEAGDTIESPVDQIMVPTFIDDIAQSIKLLVEKNAWGVYHVVGSQPLSPFDASVMIAEEFGLDKTNIHPTSHEVFYKNRAPRPLRVHLRNDKIAQYGLNLKTFKEGLRSFK